MSRVRTVMVLVLLALILPLAPAQGSQRQQPLPRVEGRTGQTVEVGWTALLTFVRHVLEKAGVHIDGNG